MLSKKIENHIVKYLSNQATLSELDELSLWLENPTNIALFNNYVKTNYAITYAMKQYNTNQTKKYLIGVINKEKKRSRLLKMKQDLFKYAAVAILFLCLGYGYQQGYFSKQSKLEIPSQNITLQLNDKEKLILKIGESKRIFTFNKLVLGTQTGNQLSYKNEGIESLVYNTLTVPYGKRFKVQLSDGTLVDLNAGSSLKYPVNFIEGKNRQVFLKGEAFFDVAKDAKHPFIVNANEVDVRVLGTKFNVSSYPEDENINTVLIEGSVSTYKKGETYNSEKATILKPGYKAAWHKKNKIMNVDKTNIEVHTAWIDGRLILHEVPFNDILKKLERQYNVTFVNNNKTLEGRYFTAKFDVEDIYQVVESLSYSGNFTYKFDEDKIIINP